MLRTTKHLKLLNAPQDEPEEKIADSGRLHIFLVALRRRRPRRKSVSQFLRAKRVAELPNNFRPEPLHPPAKTCCSNRCRQLKKKIVAYFSVYDSEH